MKKLVFTPDFSKRVFTGELEKSASSEARSRSVKFNKNLTDLAGYPKFCWTKFGIMIVFLSIFGISHKSFCESLEVVSKVAEATIYASSAQITRQAEVNVKEGINEIVFANIPENLDESTLTVSAIGQAKAKILDAKVKRIFLEKPESERVKALEEEIIKLEDNITEFNSQSALIAEEREYLRSIRLFAGQQIPEDLVTKMPEVTTLDSLDTFLKQKWQDTYSRELEIKKGSVTQT